MRWKIEDTPQQAEFREQFRTWLREQLPAGWLEAADTDDQETLKLLRLDFDQGRWGKVFGESGYAAPLWPKEYGGLSGEAWMQHIVREELGRAGLPRVGLNILGIGLAGPTLIAHGTEEQKERYLRKILTSEEIWCQLFSEPGAGSDLASLATRAERHADEWVVNGQKVWTTIAQFAKFGMLVTRTDPTLPKHSGLTYFIVDMKAPGVEVRPLKQMTGSEEFNEVYLTDVRIPDEMRVGEVGQGWEVARTTLMNERIALSGIGGGRGGTATDTAHALAREANGGLSPHFRQEIARMYVGQEVKDITGVRGEMARRTGQPGPEGGVGKIFNAELNQERTNLTMNAAGPAAIAWMPGDRHAEGRATQFLRARANTIEGGTSEILRNQVAERILGLPRDIAVDKDVPWKEIRRS